VLVLSILLTGCSDQGYTTSTQDRLDDLVQQNDELQERNDSLQNSVDEANNEIRDAQSNAWDDYETMGDSLDGLQEVDDY
jgi:uncharacterized protein YlxW (UPF0749 family)